MPAPGPDLPLRAWRHADADPQAHAREAGPDLAAHQARPRALHPLLPVHALLGGRVGRHAARPREPRGALDHHDIRGPPVREPASGNVTKLCPVGALTSATYRFRARPWETQQIPSVCGLCAVGCNTAVNIREGHVVRVLSRNHPEIDEGWLCDKGRYAFGLLASEERITTGLIRGGRGLEQVAPYDALDHIADRLRATVERFGPGSVAVLASGEQTNEEAHAWARLLDEGLGGGISVCGPEGGAGWEALAPYAASIADIGTAGAVVVAGDIDLAHRAPVVELRIRKAVQAGARVVTVGAGGTRLETLRRAHHASAGPGTAHVELLRAAGNDGELAAAVGDASTVVIWAGPMRPAIAAVLAHLAHARGWTVLRTPRAANELGCQAAGLGSATPDEALAAADEGRIKAIVLLGADPVGDWHNGERWRAALGRSFFALQVTATQNDSSGWATTIVPAATVLEQDGTLTNLEGRTQRVRAAATAPRGVLEGTPWPPGSPSGWASSCRLTRRRPSPTWPPAALPSPASAGRRSARPGARRAAGAGRSARGAARRPGRDAGGHGRGGSPRAHVGRIRRQQPGPPLPAALGHRDLARRRPGPRPEAGRLAAGPPTAGARHQGAAVVLRRLRPGVVRVAARRPYVGSGTVVAVEPEATDA